MHLIFSLLWLENVLCIFYFRGLFYDPGYGVFWYMFCVCLKKICVLLLLDGMFCIRSFWVLLSFVCMPLFCLDLSVVGKEVFKYTVVNTNLSVSPFSFSSFRLKYFDFFRGMYIHGLLYFLGEWTPLSLRNFSLNPQSISFPEVYFCILS